ncbi:DUF4270 family protein [Sediminibacterium soli]|uniref:DUF4270 family protein n=1 Tax=Sediminibacterium soli TaxID=2698829 RepID=UPI00137B6FCF|nr:DUF4270 family protein [Sediminibacterium soli]NCI45846.1 DUF4270 domain-containing protein [Sediminibacterium soli]
MHSLITLRNTLIAFIVSAAFLSACTRISSTELGRDLIPPIDGVFTKDTLLDVITDSFESTDTTRIYSSDNAVFGTISNDPLFGKSRASMFFELKPAAYPFYIPGHKDSIVVDSAVLILGYSGLYGDSMQPLRLTVSEISQSTRLILNRAYPAEYPGVTPVTTAAAMAPPLALDIRRIPDSVNNRFENAKNQIRIKMNANIAKRFIKDYDSTNAYRSDSAFRTYFAGFALTTDAGTPANALVKISLADTNTKFALYYSSSSTGATRRDTSVTYFKFSSSTGGFANFVVRDRSGSEAAQHLTTTSRPDSLVYVQTSPGTYVRIRVPGLASLSNRIVHRAELIAEQVPDDANLQTIEKQMLPPRYLLLSVYDSVKKVKRNITNDYILSSNGPNMTDFGGFVTSKAATGYDKISAYTFSLTRYVQGIVTRKDTAFTLRLSAPTNDSLLYKTPYPDLTMPLTSYITPTLANDAGIGRVRLGGGTHSRFRMRLRVIFSRI